MMKRHNLTLNPCIYDESEKIIKIISMLGVTPEVYTDDREKTSGSFNLLDSRNYMKMKWLKAINRTILQQASLMKHPSFLEEQEWRIIPTIRYERPIISGPTDPIENNNEVFYRIGKNKIIPYIKMPLVDEINNLEVEIDEIVIGRTMNQEFAFAVLEQIFHGKAKPNIILSEIPFRSPL